VPSPEIAIPALAHENTYAKANLSLANIFVKAYK